MLHGIKTSKIITGHVRLIAGGIERIHTIICNIRLLCLFLKLIK